MKKEVFATLVAALAFASGAETRTWTNGTNDGKWSTPGNWSPEGVPGEGDTAQISGDWTFNEPVEVPADMRLEHLNNGTLAFVQDFVLNGTVANYAGNIYFAPPSEKVDAFTGTGTIEIHDSEVQFAGWLNSPSAILKVVKDGGNICFGTPGCDWAGLPVLGGFTEASVFNGNFKLQPGMSCVAPAYLAAVAQSSSVNGGQLEVMTGGARSTTSIQNATWTLWNCALGYGGNYGALEVANGGVLNVNDAFYLGRAGNPQYSTSVTVKEGGTFRLNRNGGEYLRIGSDESERGGYHQIVVDGGVFEVPNTSPRLGYRSNNAAIIVKSGRATMKGLQFRDQEKIARPDAGDVLLRVSGGELQLGADNLSSPAVEFRRRQMDFEAGKLTALDNFGLWWGRLIAAFGDDARGGKDFTFDLNGKYVEWKTPLLGASDVTVTGGGTFVTQRTLQGVPTGKWTAGENTEVNLIGAAALPGGVEAKAGSRVVVNMPSQSLAEFMILPTSELPEENHAEAFAAIRNYAKSYPFVVGTLEKLHEQLDSGDLQHCIFAYRGEFYVASEQEGTWYFAGTFDDGIMLDIDGTAVIENTGWNDVQRGNIELSEGWHSFVIATLDKTGGQGPARDGWKGKMALGYTLDAEKGGSSSGENYTRFDTDTVPMRVKAGQESGVRMRISYNSYSSEDFKGEPRGYPNFIYDTHDFMTNTLASLHTQNGDSRLQGKAARFEGWFEVTPEQAGTWVFKGRYDDNIALLVDDVELFSTAHSEQEGSGEVALAAGWHRYEIAVRDGAGAWGGWTTDSSGRVCAVKARYPGTGATYYAFDVDNFRLIGGALDRQKCVPRGGLGGTVKLAAGSVLNNSLTGVLSATAACPIYGTLEGAGALDGRFRFVEGSLWKVKGSATEITESVKMDVVANGDLFDQLGGIDVEFSAKPTVKYYSLGTAKALTEEKAQAIPVVAHDAEGKAAGAFTADVRDGELVLVQTMPTGTVLILR